MKKITLLTPIDYDGRTITHVMLREPNAAEFMAHGEPYIQTHAADGRMVSIEDGAAIATYLSLVIAEPAGLPLDRVGLADGMRLKDAVLDFFGDARRAGWKTAQTASSAPSDGSTQEASGEHP
jgi:hypothetical protein